MAFVVPLPVVRTVVLVVPQLAKHSNESSNCTLLELKHNLQSKLFLNFFSSNCTLLELKQEEADEVAKANYKF